MSRDYYNNSVVPLRVPRRPDLSRQHGARPTAVDGIGIGTLAVQPSLGSMRGGAARLEQYPPPLPHRRAPPKANKRTKMKNKRGGRRLVVGCDRSGRAGLVRVRNREGATGARARVRREPPA